MSEFFERQFSLGPLPQVNPVGMQEATRTIQQSAQTLNQTGENLYQAGRDMYLMDIESQAREQLRTAFEANQSNPEGFAKQADSVRKGLSKSKVLPSIRTQGDKIYKDLFDAYNQKVKSNYQQKVSEDYKFSVYKTLDQRQRDINALMAASINTDGSINPEAVGQMAKLYGSIESSMYATGPDGQYLFEPSQRLSMQKSAIQTAATSAAMTGLAQAKDPIAYAERFSNGELGFDMEVDGKTQRISLRDYVDKSTAKLVISEAKRSQAEYEAKQKEQQDVFESRLSYNLQQASTVDELENIMYNVDSMRGQMPEDKYWQLKETVNKRSEKLLEGINAVSAGANFATGQAILNPAVKSDREALDNYYTSVIAPQELPYPEKNARIATMVDNAKIAPKSLLGELQSAAYSSDIGRLEQASDLMTRIYQTNSNVYNDIPENTKAAINTFTQLRLAGYAPEIIQEKLSALRQPQSPSMVEARRKIVDDKFGNFEDFDVVDEVYDSGLAGWVSIQPDVTDPQRFAMQEAYKEVYKTQFVMTGDEDVSRLEAARVVSQQFVPTKVNGRKEVMRYAPDNYYSIPNVDNDWIREDMLEYAKGKLQGSLQSWDSVKDRIFLIPNPIFTPQTASEGRPLYDVVIKGDDGQLRPINSDGTGWYPDKEKKLKQLRGK